MSRRHETQYAAVSMWMLTFSLLPLLALAYIGWHVWCLLPLSWIWKVLILALMTGAFRNHGVGSGDHFKIIDYLCKRNMTKEDKDILLRLLQQHKELGISEQIDYQKFYLDSLISNSVALSDMEPEPIAPEMVDKRSIYD